MNAASETTTVAPEGALAGIRVLDIAGPFGNYCGKLFADLGADVVLVEPLSGSPWRREGPFIDGIPGTERSLQHCYQNTSKRGIALDLDTAEGQAALKTLALSADLVIETERPGTMTARGLGPADLSSIRPSLVYTSISAFGQSGPYAKFEAEDIVVYALGGMLYLGGYPETAPLAAYGLQAIAAGQVFGAVASMAALLRAEATGCGEHIDVSMQECVAMGLETAAQTYDFDKVVRKRAAGSQFKAGSGVFPCKDGHVYLLSAGVGANRFWDNTISWLTEGGAPGADVLRDPCWAERDYLPTDDAKAIFDSVFVPFAATRTKAELYASGQRHRVPICPVSTPADVLANRQLRHRDFFVDVDSPLSGHSLRMPGAPYRMAGTPWRIRSRAPLLGEHNVDLLQRAGSSLGLSNPTGRPATRALRAAPLDGIRVVDFCWVGAGSYTTKLLGDLGADVIKIESETRLDSLRLAPPFAGGVEGLNRSGYFADRNTSKRSITINLKDPKGVDLARELILQADVVANNFTPGTMQRFGLGYDGVRALKPDIVYAEMSMQGADGPERDYLGYGLTIGALTGLQYLCGIPGRVPAGTGTNYPDHIPNPCHAAFSILAAIRHRRRTGAGQYIDLAQTEPMLALLAPAFMDCAVNGIDVVARGNQHRAVAPYGVYPVRGHDRWIAIAAATDQQWNALVEVLGAPELSRELRWRSGAVRYSEHDALDVEIARSTAIRQGEELMLALQARGVPAGVVRDAADLIERDPQLAHRHHWQRLEHPEMGLSLYNGLPFSFANAVIGLRSRAPMLGEHTVEVAESLLGLSAEVIATLRLAKVLL